jgi:hypothetical protein
MITQLLKIVRESIKAVPAMKYALAVAGILAVVAMVGAFRLSPQTAIFGAVITLVLMVAMVIFARLATTAPKHFLLPVKVMMWAFLCVTVATAFLLFTSAFFRWPRGLRELLDPSATPQVGRGETNEAREWVALAKQQRERREYDQAWVTIERALALSPSSEAARDEQLQIALVWLRNLSIPSTDSFARRGQPLLDLLERRLASAKGTLAADIHAHIGIGNRWRFRSTEEEPRVDGEFAAAVALDDTNPFARAMTGMRLSERRRPLAEVKEQFRLALSSGRERAFVQEKRVAAFDEYDPEENYREMLNIADEARSSGEIFSIEARRSMFSAAFYRFGRDHEAALLESLPPAQLLATLRWLVKDLSEANSVAARYYFARLAEATGDFATAAAGYRALVNDDTIFDKGVRAGLARCEQFLAKAGDTAGARN